MCCMICSEWELGKLTAKEALRNLGELIDTEDSDSEGISERKNHYFEVANKIIDSELPVIDENDVVDTLSLDSDDIEEDSECL